MPPKSNYKKKVRRPALRRYTQKRGGVTASTVRKIVKSVTAKKCETKLIGSAVYDQFVGQIDNDDSGYLTLDVTPLLPTGTGKSQRIGNLVDWVSAHYQFQIMEQSNATNTDVQFKFMLIHDKCPENNNYNTGDDNNPIEKMFNRNNFIRTAGGAETQVRDYSSPRDIEYMSRFKILATKKIYMKGDTVVNSSQRVRTFNMGLKFKKPMKQRYTSTATTDYIPSSAGSVFLCVMCNSGNIGPVQSTLSGIPRDAIQSGYFVGMNTKSYFKDY